MIEEWKDIEGFDGYYQVSNLGSVKNKHGLIMKQATARNGYKHLMLKYGKPESPNRLVHRLVAQAFLPNKKNKSDVNHINSNRRDNRVCNLEWVTRSENILHSYNKNNKKTNSIAIRGGNNPNALLTIDKVREIKKRIASGESLKVLSKDFDCSYSNIKNIKSGKCWGYVRV